MIATTTGAESREHRGIEPGFYELVPEQEVGCLGIWFEDEPLLSGVLPAVARCKYLLRLNRAARGVFWRVPTQLLARVPFVGSIRRLGAGDIAAALAARPLSAVTAFGLRRRFALGLDERRNGYAVLLPAGPGVRQILGARAAARSKAAAHANEGALARLGLEDGSPHVRCHPEIESGWPPATGLYIPVLPPRAGRIAVGVHLHYEELWPEIDSVLRNVGHEFDLHVTVTTSSLALAEAIQASFPAARIHQFPNRGKDTSALLALLNSGVLDPYRYVCWIHGKKTVNSPPLVGLRWRRYAFAELLGSPHQVAAILDRFDADPCLGIVGPTALRCPSWLISEPQAWGKNRKRILKLAARMGLSAQHLRLDFYLGSMQWFRPAALEPLRRIQLSHADFPRELGQNDGTMAHAVERLFLASAEVAGFYTALSSQPVPAAGRQNLGLPLSAPIDLAADFDQDTRSAAGKGFGRSAGIGRESNGIGGQAQPTGARPGGGNPNDTP